MLNNLVDLECKNINDYSHVIITRTNTLSHLWPFFINQMMKVSSEIRELSMTSPIDDFEFVIV